MTTRKKRLVLDQVDRKIAGLQQLDLQVPEKGWINTIRTALNMSMRQLADRVKKKAQNIQASENNEANGTINLQSLNEIAEALDMKVVYAIIPKQGTLHEMIVKQAYKKATEIVERTSTSMALEDQENSKDRLNNAKMEKVSELVNEMPKFLWD